MKKHRQPLNAALSGTVDESGLKLSFSGRLDAESVGSLWPDVRLQLETEDLQSIALDASDIDYCDGAGIALLVYIRRVASRLGLALEIDGLKADYAGLLNLYPEEKFEEPPGVPKGMRDFVEQVGKAVVDTLLGIRDQVAFLGELTSAMFRTLLHPTGLRFKDFLSVAENSGARALPIIGMLGFLVGLIMAFQGAVLMAQFGAEIYIADFVGMSVTRELGPLITAIIVAGRTGSAFAAEIGTMKVNEEIDAFTTMGLDPVRFLVIPRVLAATLMTPLLTVFSNLFGMAGGAVVMRGIGFPLVTYVHRIVASVSPVDFIGGLIKAFVFGVLISAAGCLCGLRTGEGASAVGNSATRAVVSSIVMIVIADGIFSVIYYYLGI
jgi:phospholipid/cholesterol/gamma-HCH transport system permease protein